MPRVPGSRLYKITSSIFCYGQFSRGLFQLEALNNHVHLSLVPSPLRPLLLLLSVSIAKYFFFIGLYRHVYRRKVGSLLFANEVLIAVLKQGTTLLLAFAGLVDTERETLTFAEDNSKTELTQKIDTL